MRKANRFALLAAGLVVLAVLLLVLWPARQVGQTAQVGAGEPATAAAALALPTPNSPLPSATAPALPEPATPPPDATPVDWTGISDIPVVQFSELTPAPFTPEPWVPPTPYPEDMVVSDPSNILSVVVPKGWYATFTGESIVGGGAEIASYDLGKDEGRPEDGIDIYFGMGALEPGQTFEQWIAERRQLEAHPEYAPQPSYITESSPITLAGYSGVTYTLGLPIGDGEEIPVQSIYLSVGDRWVVGIGVSPVSSPNYQAALSVLQTLTLTPR